MGARHGILAIEIKRSRAPKIEKGFRIALDDIKPSRADLVHGGGAGFSMGDGIEAIGVSDLAKIISGLK